MKHNWLFPLMALAPFVATGCTPHVAIDPIKVEPIHILMDVNLKVDRELDNFFAYQKPATQPASAEATPSTQPTTTPTAEKL